MKYPSEISDFYLRLEVGRNANYEELKKAYREKALLWHPDRNPTQRERAHIEFIAVSEAFENLLCKGKQKAPRDYSDMKKAYEYSWDMFNEIFKGENLGKLSPELRIIMKLFREFTEGFH